MYKEICFHKRILKQFTENVCELDVTITQVEILKYVIKTRINIK